MEDLDGIVARRDIAHRQLHDLAALGLDWDGPVVFQSERTEPYREAVARLEAAGLTYRCFCTRREIREAASAPNGSVPEGAYRGTCRTLSAVAVGRLLDAGRRPAVRLRADGSVVAFNDELRGPTQAIVDDLVLVRNDGVFAYNLAVVVDDAAQGVTQVVRADDLLSSTPRQIWLGDQLGLPRLTYAHVPLVLGPDGQRLAKRHGSVSLGDLVQRGWSVPSVVGVLARSLGLGAVGDQLHFEHLMTLFRGRDLPVTPWQLSVDDVTAFNRGPE